MMAGNTFGKLYSVTSFGESHGKAIGGVIDGCPPGTPISELKIQKELDRRRPGQSKITTPRDETDNIEILSGVFEGKSTGTPIGFLIRNKDQRSQDYDNIENVFRPSHADYTYTSKYGIRDHRGGGRSSARETISRVVAGAIAKEALSKYGIIINAFTSKIADIGIEIPLAQIDFSLTESNIVRCPDAATAEKMIQLIDAARIEGDSLGGIVTCVIKNSPVGLGEPVFDKLHAVLGHAMLSINAVKGFEIGSGFEGTLLRGSEHNDEFYIEKAKVRTRTNNSGGIQGGISNGEDIVMKIAFTPVATVLKEQKTIFESGNETV